MRKRTGIIQDKRRRTRCAQLADHGRPAYVCYSKDTNRMRADVNRKCAL